MKRSLLTNDILDSDHSSVNNEESVTDRPHKRAHIYNIRPILVPSDQNIDLRTIFLAPVVKDTCTNTMLWLQSDPAAYLTSLEWIRQGLCTYESLCDYSSKINNFEVLKWARSGNLSWSGKTCVHAIQNKNTDILLWALDNGCPLEGYNYPTVGQAAIQSEDIDMINLVHKYNCPWYQCCSWELTRIGNLEILKWFLENNCYQWDDTLCEGFVREGHLHILKWARKNNYTLSPDICEKAAEAGRLNVIIWARKHHFLWGEYFCSNAAREGHVDVLKWASQNGCVFDKDICFYAVTSRHFETLKYCHELSRKLGFPLHDQVCFVLAEGGPLDMFIWAVEQGFPWKNKYTCRAAAHYDNLPVLQWARENGCPWDQVCCIYAIKENNLEVLEWLLANGCPRDELVCLKAAKCHNLNALQIARKYQCPWSEQTTEFAAYYCKLKILIWAYENGCPITPFTVDCAIYNSYRFENKKMDMLNWLQSEGYIHDISLRSINPCKFKHIARYFKRHQLNNL